MPLDRHGPQNGLFGGRWNPIHTMLATGPDAVAGRYDKTPGIRYCDDAINMPVQAATHWDAIGHIFYDDKMYNGFDAREADCSGLGKLGIEHTKSRMVGRGVLIDIARGRLAATAPVPVEGPRDDAALCCRRSRTARHRAARAPDSLRRPRAAASITPLENGATTVTTIGGCGFCSGLGRKP
jgi:Putative cyclase